MNERMQRSMCMIAISAAVLLTVYLRSHWFVSGSGSREQAGSAAKTVEAPARVSLLEALRQQAVSTSEPMEAEPAPGGADETDDLNPFLNKPITEVYARWLQLVQTPEVEGDEFLAQAALAQLVRTDAAKSEVLPEIDRLILDAAVPESTRVALARMLGESATSDGLLRLLEINRQNASAPAVRNATLDAIGDLASHRWDDSYREELTPTLLESWKQAASDPELRRALGKAIAEAGSPAGVEVLFSTILSAGATAEELRKSQSADTWTAVEAVNHIANPSAIEPLSAYLRQSQEGGLAYLAAGSVLANMGRVEATQSILEYAQTAPESAAPYIQSWLAQVKDARSLRLIRETADQFPQPSMRQAVRNAWESWYAQRSLQKPL
jgi:hypothetical protein